MTNYGMRISKEGVDVKTGADKDMVVTSKYANLKGAITGSASGVAVDGTTTTITINTHNLGYIPIFQTNINYNSEGFYRLIPTQIEIDFFCWAHADSTKLYISLYNNTGSSKAVSFKYYIFLDKGKLT